MKKINKILSIILCLMMVFTTLNFNVRAEDSLTISDENGSVESVSLSKQEKITLSVSTSSDCGWQLSIGSDQSKWVNIYGQDKNSITLSYAMVNSLLDEQSIVYLRCLTSSNVSNVVKINVVDELSTNNIVTASLQKMMTSKSISNSISTTQETNSDLTSHTITINYVFENGSLAHDPYLATIEYGGDLSTTVTFPTVVGYLPYVGTDTTSSTSLDINLTNITSDVTYTVTYKPTMVDYKVIHKIQNVSNDEYTIESEETKQGLTGSQVGDCAKTLTGFSALLYEKPEIAADGSTVVEVYYDRNYYLLNFDLDGGYGVDPIYARYGTPINNIGTPKKAGYTFGGWSTTVPTEMEATNKTIKALWIADDSVSYSVVFWYENADDANYSYVGSVKGSAEIGASVSSGDYKNTSFDGRDDSHFTYNSEKAETITVKADGSSVVNVYFKRNTYLLTFKNAITTTTLSCGKTEHTHSDSCCTYGGTSLWHWKHSDSCCSLGLEEHTHDSTCYKADLVISAKYNQEISSEFSKAPFTTDYNGRAWKCTDSSKYSYALQTLDRMPGFEATFELYNQSSQIKKTIYYYVQKVGTTVSDSDWPSSNENFDLLKQVDTYFNYATYDEEYHEIEGFTRYKKSISGFDDDSKDFSNNALSLYYLRNSYNLKFYNYDSELTDQQKRVQYQESLSSYEITPDYPANLEPNAYYFAGWYTSPGCYDGSEVNWSSATMPSSDLMLYAKWAPVTHTVKTYLTEELVGTTEIINKWDKVNHRSVIENKPLDPTNGQYKFVGWFYKENGVEKPFDFSMAIVKNLELYAKWSSDVLVSYVIKYQLEDGTVIANNTSSSAIAGSSKTFEAKTGNDLYEDYREGYYPLTNSHTLSMNIEGNNEYVFVYTYKESVPYTVRYLEKGTDAVLLEEKVVSDNKKSVVTETFEFISGYVPDAYQKRLVVSADESENVITFYYEKDDVHAYYVITHWIQNVEGDGYSEYRTIQNVGTIGETITETPLTLKGFVYNESKSNSSGTVTSEGLKLDLYYDRVTYPLTIKYLEYGTDKQLAQQTVLGEYRYGKNVSAEAKDIAGYDLVGNKYRYKLITDGTNEIIFYYVEQEVDIKYVVVDEGTGSVSVASETVKVVSGTANGSIPTAAQKYRFVGWYTDEACSTLVDENWVDANNKLVPQKVNGQYKAATYYAKFELNVVELTITKTGSEDIDENQTFLFRVQGLDEVNKDVDLTVTIHGNGSITISDLIVGNYKVSELSDWSFRYNADSNVKSINIVEDYTISFSNTRDKKYWLDGNNYQNNIFGIND